MAWKIALETISSVVKERGFTMKYGLLFLSNHHRDFVVQTVPYTFVILHEILFQTTDFAMSTFRVEIYGKFAPNGISVFVTRLGCSSNFQSFEGLGRS